MKNQKIAEDVLKFDMAPKNDTVPKQRCSSDWWVSPLGELGNGKTSGVSTFIQIKRPSISKDDLKTN